MTSDDLRWWTDAEQLNDRLPQVRDVNEPITWLTTTEAAATSCLLEHDILRFVDHGRLSGYLIKQQVMISKTELRGFLETLDLQV